MRKHRKWWMGFGLGIALGAMLLQVIAFAQEQSRFLEEGEKVYTQEQMDRAIVEAQEAATAAVRTQENGTGPDGASADGTNAGGANADGASQSPGQDTAQSGPTATPAVSEISASSGAADEDLGGERIVAFYVNRGMDLRTVARSLQALGVIDDADDFTEAARPVSKRIEIGTASFTGQPSYEEIIAELTRYKDD